MARSLKKGPFADASLLKKVHNDAGMVGAVYYFRQTMEEKE